MENKENNINTNAAELNAAELANIEKTAELANSLNSFSDYKPGSASATIKQELEEAAANLAHGLKRCATDKQRDDLRAKFSLYKNKIVAYYADYYKNEAACPSVLISGPANFPTRKKAAQNARRDSLTEEYKRLESLKDSLRGGWGSMAISSDDPQAAEALKAKIEALKKSHAVKVAANEFYRKNKTLNGFDQFTPEQQEKANRDIQKWDLRAPFPAWNLSNENANIKRLEDRLKELEDNKSETLEGWNFNGGRVEIDAENNRIGVYWDAPKRGAELEEITRQNQDYSVPRLLWSPRFQRWQCQNTLQNRRRLYNSKTYAPADDESRKAIEAAQQEAKARRAAREAEEAKAKEEKEKRAAENFAARAHSLQAKQDELKKTGFLLKPAMLAHVSNNLSEYMKAGHGIRRIIKAGEDRALFVEIHYSASWERFHEFKNISVSIDEYEIFETSYRSGAGYMTALLKLRDVPEGEKRQLKTLQQFAARYDQVNDDARLIALYEAYKSGSVKAARLNRWMDHGNEIAEADARAFLEAWKPGDGTEPKQEEPKAATEPKQEAPRQEEPAQIPPQHQATQPEQLTLF